MFEFDAGKLIIIGIVALIVIGPKELPRVLRQVGQAMAQLRRIAAEFQSQFSEAMREAELADIKEEAAKLAASARIETGFNPIAELKGELTRAIDGIGPAPDGLPAGDAGGAALQPAQGENSILAADGFEAGDGNGALAPEPAAAAGQGEPAVVASAQGPGGAREPPHAGAGGEPLDLGPPEARVEPVSRT